MTQYITSYVDDKKRAHTIFNRTLDEALKRKTAIQREGFNCALTVREIIFPDPLVLHKQIR